MTFVLRIQLPTDLLPRLPDLADEAADRLEMDVELDPESVRAVEAGRREASWCPWPRPLAGLFVPGATTRGAELDLEPVGGTGTEIEAQVTVPALATWADWRLGVALASALAERAAAGARVDGVGAFLADGLRVHFEDDDSLYWAECAAGATALAQAIREGRVVRVGGPGGYAVIGPRTWLSLIERDESREDLAAALIDRIAASVERRGYEDHHVATPMVLDGRDGRQVTAAVLAPGRPTLARDPEYLLLSEDLEADGGAARLFLLPLREVEAAFAGRASWLDDRTVALPAIPRAAWAAELARLRPLLIQADVLLDAPTHEPEPRAGEPPAEVRGRWWKLW